MTGNRQFHHGAENIVGLREQGYDVPLPLYRFQEDKNIGCKFEQFGRYVTQAKLGVREIAVILRGAVVRFETLDNG